MCMVLPMDGQDMYIEYLLVGFMSVSQYSEVSRGRGINPCFA